MEIYNIVSWVELLNIIILARIIFIGIKKGFIVEFFKFSGILFSVFIAAHYYSGLAEFFQNSLLNLNVTVYQAIAFVLLWSAGVGLFKLMRDGLLVLFVIEAKPVIDRWGGGIIAVARGILTASLFTFVLVLSNLTVVSNVPSSTLSRKFLAHVVPNTYQFIFDGFIVKFFSDEKLNQETFIVVNPPKEEKK